MKFLFCTVLLFSSLSLMAQAIDVKHLSLDLSFDWQKRQASGIAGITLSPGTATDKIKLDAAMLTINAVSINGRSLKYNYNEKNSELVISLDKVYKQGNTFTLQVHYHTNYENRADPNSIGGSFGKGLRFFQPTSTTPNKRRQVWSSGEHDHNKYWFPCNENIKDIHTTEITASLEKPLMLISNGELIETKENHDNTRTFHYRSTNAYPNYLVFIAIGEYVAIDQKLNNTILHNFGYPDEKEAVKATTVLLPAMMNFLENKTGHKYPYAQYSQVVVQDYPFPGSVGQHSASLLSDNYIDAHGVHEDFKYLWDGVALQALANQWFGNLIMPVSWDHIWLNNAFAQYFSGLYTAENNGKAEYLTWYHPFEKGAVLSDWDSENKHPIVSNKYKDLAGFTNDNYSKLRGTLVLRMLQKEVGEENWWKAIKLYVRSNANKLVTTTDLQIAFERSAGISYQWFFDQWIYKIGLPFFVVTKKYDHRKKQLTIIVKQHQTKIENSPYPQVQFFQGKIEIEIDSKIQTINIAPKDENKFTFSLPWEPLFVNFNYEESFLCVTVFKRSHQEYFNVVRGSKDVLARQQAIDTLVLIANDPGTNLSQKKEIAEALKKEITNNQHYWRYRQYALGALRRISSIPHDEEMKNMLIKLIKTERSWLRSAAVFTLGNTLDPGYLDLYFETLNDSSDRVINSAAVAIGKTKSPRAFSILSGLENKPSWKNQNRISALNGFQQLGDTNAVEYILKCIEDNRSPRWYLATPAWDYPFAAVNTLVSLGKAHRAYPILAERFKRSLIDNDINDIFQNVQLINLLNDKRAKEVYELLRSEFKNDPNILEAVTNYEKQFIESIINDK